MTRCLCVLWWRGRRLAPIVVAWVLTAPSLILALPSESSATTGRDRARAGRDACRAVRRVPLDIPEPPGIASSVWENGTIGLAIPIENFSADDTLRVKVTRLEVP